MSDIQNLPLRSSSDLGAAGSGWARGAAVAALAGTATLLLSEKARALSLTYNDSIPGTGDIKVLNYALVLEDFEAALYQAALTTLTALGAGSGNAFYNYALEFAQVEQDHAAFLRNTLTSAGGPVVSPFQYNLTAVTGAAAPVTILELLLQVEATGARAYLGAIPLFAQGSKYLQIAAAIQATEARHTSTLTNLHNTLYATTLDVTPLSGDNNLTGKFTNATFQYENYNPAGYNPLKPDEGVAGVEANLQPNTVLTAISPFFAAPASS